MNSESIETYLEKRIDAGDFPSAAYLVASRGQVIYEGALGNAVVFPELIPARTSTIFDVASLTKVMVTGLLMAILIENGEVSLEDAAADFLPEMADGSKENITVGQLISHTSGLPSWLPLYLLVPAGGLVMEAIAAAPLAEGPPDTVYSDLNFIVLGKLIERVTGQALDEAFEDAVVRPLNLTDTMFVPFEILRRRIAASEGGRLFEKQAASEAGFDTSDHPQFFNESVWGSVHDGNARFMGGVAGHAGLFSTLRDTYVIAKQFLPNESSMLKAETCELFTKNLTAGLSEDRSLAFQLASTPRATAGGLLAPQSFGHLGFTGTSLWIDPVKEAIFILFTNRTHAHALPFENINGVRRRFHELAAAGLRNQ